MVGAEEGRGEEPEGGGVPGSGVVVGSEEGRVGECTESTREEGSGAGSRFCGGGVVGAEEGRGEEPKGGGVPGGGAEVASDELRVCEGGRRVRCRVTA